jgi:DNA adenine methylase
MKYMGSKNRISKHILPIMLSERKSNQWWIEPFVGGGNMIDKVSGNRLGSDYNPYSIEALISIRDRVLDLPKTNSEFNEQDYKELKYSNIWYKGYAGFSYSYGGKWLGGWRRDRIGMRDYVKESYNSALRQNSKLQDVILINKSYLDLDIPPNSIIYCDPPYQNTTGYTSKFDHDEFWQWCRIKESEGHAVFVSEYDCPTDFTCLWEKEVSSSLTKNTGSKRSIERLFRYYRE